MTEDLIQRLRVRGPQPGERINHYTRRMEVERVEAADRIDALESWKTKARKVIAKAYGTVALVVSGLTDEGDRVYLESTNHADWLRDLDEEWSGFKVMGEDPSTLIEERDAWKRRAEKAEAEVAKLRAHVAATCRMCNGTGIRGGSGGTNPPRAETWPCDHGLSALTAPADPQPVDAASWSPARRRLEAIADQMIAGTRDGGLHAGRELKRSLEGVFADDPQPSAWNEAIRAAVEVCRKFSRAPDTTPEEAAAALDCALRIQDLLRPEGGE